MNSRNPILAAASALMLYGLQVTSAMALPGLSAAGDQQASLVVKTAGCHRSCEYGPVLGWHRHGAACRPIACRPLAIYPNRCFVDRYGVRRCRW